MFIGFRMGFMGVCECSWDLDGFSEILKTVYGILRLGI